MASSPNNRRHWRKFPLRYILPVLRALIEMRTLKIHICKPVAKPTKSVWHRIEAVYLGLALIAIVAFLLIVSVLIFYRTYFPGSISAEHGDWAEFGTFLGGVLTPAFSFLTFLALLVTIIFQRFELKNSQSSLFLIREELELAKAAAEKTEEFNKNESERAELFNMIKFVHNEINNLHSSKVDFAEDSTLGFFFSSSASSKGISSIPKNGDPVTDHDRVILADLCDYITELSNYLNNYEGKFGASALTYYYKKRHATASNRLIEKGFLLKPMLGAFEEIGYSWTAPDLTK
ncbi:hypothetical protein [Vreelandella boliviensis]|uniref:hypothetical protein n=1 Tax=Vreelandella boliviensis TaxID=223527 RepID=UPI001B8BA423|nr:hypothetical protein [Halomonas boliviensis]MBS3669238.1 hypothetical protein [Halomonas boliviensis]